MSYFTYAIGTRKNHTVYLLSEITEYRIWTNNPDKAMMFFSEGEVQHIIQKFKIPNAAVARIKHKTA